MHHNPIEWCERELCNVFYHRLNMHELPKAYKPQKPMNLPNFMATDEQSLIYLKLQPYVKQEQNISNSNMN